MICRDCWNGTHGEWHDNGNRKWFVDGCKVAECKCLCRDIPNAAAHELGLKAARTKERNENRRKALEDSPLRAVNPKFDRSLP